MDLAEEQALLRGVEMLPLLLVSPTPHPHGWILTSIGRWIRLFDLHRPDTRAFTALSKGTNPSRPEKIQFFLEGEWLLKSSWQLLWI